MNFWERQKLKNWLTKKVSAKNELKTTNKMIRVSAKFKEARNDKKWKLYVFDIEDYNQYYI